MDVRIDGVVLNVQETLRIYSPAPLGTAREALCDTTLGGRYKIPKVTFLSLFSCPEAKASPPAGAAALECHSIDFRADI